MDIVRFIEDRLAEDEAVAKSMGVEGAGRWWVGQRFDGSLDPDGSTVFVDVRRSDGLGYIHLGTPGMLAGPTATHIARHDPARVLAEVAAKRLLLQEIELITIRDADGNMDDAFLNRPAGRLLRAMASAHADHPDYDPAWRPE